MAALSPLDGGAQIRNRRLGPYGFDDWRYHDKDHPGRALREASPKDARQDLMSEAWDPSITVRKLRNTGATIRILGQTKRIAQILIENTPLSPCLANRIADEWKADMLACAHDWQRCPRCRNLKCVYCHTGFARSGFSMQRSCTCQRATRTSSRQRATRMQAMEDGRAEQAALDAQQVDWTALD